MRQGRWGLVAAAGALALLAGCEDMAHALRKDGFVAETLREGRVDIVEVEF